MKHSKLIVLFPVYNGARTLEQSLRCIADQTLEDFRAVIVENRSTDNTLEIAAEFCAHDHRFEIAQNLKHVGPVENFVSAVKRYETECEFICMRAHDDLSSPDFLEKLCGALVSNPEKQLAVCLSVRVDDKVRSPTDHNPKIFEFPGSLMDGTATRRLNFPSDWFYGVYRCGEGTQIMRDRFSALGTPWCAASYTVAEFILRGLAIYVPGPHFEFHRLSESVQLYTEKTLVRRLLARLRYTAGFYDIRHRLGSLNFWQKARLAQIGWRDAKKKMGYQIWGK